MTERLLSKAHYHDLIGRRAVIDRLLAHSVINGCIALASAPEAGASTLLRAVFDKLYFDGGAAAPVYFEFRADETADDAAARFALEFLTQVISFRRRDRHIIETSPEICELAEIAPSDDRPWIERIIATCRRDSRLVNRAAVIRTCLSSPFRAEAAGVRSYIMFDGLERTAEMQGGAAFIGELSRIYHSADIPSVFSGLRRWHPPVPPVETIALDLLEPSESADLAARLAALSGVEINDATRDLIAVQTGGRPGTISALVASARAKGVAITSFAEFERLYVDEVLGGAVADRYMSILGRSCRSGGTAERLVRLLDKTITDGPTTRTLWQKHAGLAADSLETALNLLHVNEVINVSSGRIIMDPDDIVTRDHFRWRGSLEAGDPPRAAIVGEAIAQCVRRAPRLMAKHYRSGASLALKRLLCAFDGREVPATLIDHSKYKIEIKGSDDVNVRSVISNANARIKLPKFFFAANTTAYYPQISEIGELENSAVAVGEIDGKSTAWIAAEIDRKLEADAESTVFWLDRLEMAAISSNISNFRLWLIAREGFSDEAQTLLDERGAVGSSRRQAELLAAELLRSPLRTDSANSAYELVIPMGDDTEMVAVHTVEDIAKRAGFTAKAINQIKTAIVEVCINAAEHSLSPDRRLRLRVEPKADGIVINVGNRGIRLSDRMPANDSETADRRGWGLKLIAKLMDTVTIDETDDGTSITMTKSLTKSAAAEA